ncbi:hypothetical protein [Rhabdochromatium marinum]|uniref:hypothetical protein n=1 Tax=Rhabdochromatium marinum TaxID=48729 RepID=UPI0019068936|nr:hypothetical protein [Rhabdochromatium marinum]MBK1650344.1 hypothetical protein [Rhabdochromatium marinum]
MKPELIEYIVSRTPLQFWTRAVELLEEAFFEAYQHAETFEESERARICGQLRHYRQNAAIRAAGEDTGLTAAAPHTEPKGERYALVASEDIRLGRVAVPFNDNQPRPANHRKMIAALNSRLEPVNLSLFDPTPIRPKDGLGCLVVTVNPPRFEPQSTPAAILIGVPFSNLRGWHLLEPVSSIIAAYREEQEIKVPDNAWATLKVQLIEKENE